LRLALSREEVAYLRAQARQLHLRSPSQAAENLLATVLRFQIQRAGGGSRLARPKRRRSGTKAAAQKVRVILAPELAGRLQAQAAKFDGHKLELAAQALLQQIIQARFVQGRSSGA